MRRALLLLLIIALLVLPVALALRELSRVMVTELMRLIWLVRNQLERIPQFAVWGLLIVIVLAAAIGSLFGWSRTSLDLDEELVRVPGRVQELSHWIRRSGEGRYFRWTLNRYVSNLLWEVMAYREGTTPRRLKQRFRAGEVELPPVVADYLGAGGLSRPATRGSLWALVFGRQHAVARQTPARPALEDVIRFLEEQLEVEHDLGAG